MSVRALSAHRVVFLPSGKRGEFADGTSLLAAARTLGVDLDSVCGGRGICGRCQVDVAEGAFAKHAIRSSADHLSPWGEVESRYAMKRGPFPAEPAARMSGQDLRRSRHRRASREPGPPAGRAQARRDACNRDRSRRAPLLRRGARAGHARSVERFPPAATGLARAMGPRRNQRRSCDARRPAEDAARARMESHRRAAQGPRHRRGHARLRRARLWGRHRRRLDDDRGAPLRSHERRGRRLLRGDEPADPLRRRPDEPRLLRDDEPGRRQGAHAHSARGDGRADRRSGARGGRRAQRNPGSDPGRQSDHASPRSWP